jgi:hypothetical protein
MSNPETDTYLTSLNNRVRPVANAVNDALVAMGCAPYVKTIYIGYDINGEMVAAAYGHADHVEVALALDEDHADPGLVDASHLTWRTLPLALRLQSVADVKRAKPLLAEACERVRNQTHHVHRDNDYFIGRKGRRR